MTQPGIVAGMLCAFMACAIVVMPGPVEAQSLRHLGAMELRQPLRIETGWARAFVQHGKAVLHRDLVKFDPYCSVEVRSVATPGVSIDVLPDTFGITRVQHKHIPGGVFGGVLNLEEDPGPVEPVVDIFLESQRQPSVLRVRCVKWEADGVSATRVGMAEVTEAFGSIANFR